MKNTVIFTTILLALTSCATTPTGINDNPGSFKDITFTITGTIEQTITIPGTPVTVFLLGDGKTSLMALSLSPRVKGDHTTFKGQLMGLTSGPAPLGQEEKSLLKSILKKNKVVADGFLDLTVGVIEGTITTLGIVVKKLYFVLETE